MAVSGQINKLSDVSQAGPSAPVVKSISLVQDEDEICGFKFVSFASLDDLETHIASALECQTSTKDSLNVGQKRKLSEEEETKDTKQAQEVKKKKRKPKKKADDVEIISENWSSRSRRRQTSRRSAYGTTGYGDYLPSQLIDFVLEIEASERGDPLENWYNEEDFLSDHVLNSSQSFDSLTGVTTQSSQNCTRGENEGSSGKSSELLSSEQTSVQSPSKVTNLVQGKEFEGKSPELKVKTKKKRANKRKHVEEGSASSASIGSSEHAAVSPVEKVKQADEVKVKSKKIKNKKSTEKPVQNANIIKTPQQKNTEVGTTDVSFTESEGNLDTKEILDKKSESKDIAIGVRPKKRRKKGQSGKNKADTQCSVSVETDQSEGVSTDVALSTECIKETLSEQTDVANSSDIAQSSAQNLSIPDLNIPDLNIPDLNVPNLNIPDLSAQDISIPDLSVADLSAQDLDELELESMLENIDPEICISTKYVPIKIKPESGGKNKPKPSSSYKKLRIANQRGSVTKDTTSRTEGIDAVIRYRQKARKLTSPVDLHNANVNDYESSVGSPIVDIESNCLSASVDAVLPNNGEIHIKQEKIDEEEEFNFSDILSEMKQEELNKFSNCDYNGVKHEALERKYDADTSGNISDCSEESSVIDVEAIDDVKLPPDCKLPISSFNPHSQKLPCFGHFSSYPDLTKEGCIDVNIQTYWYDIDLHAQYALCQPGKIFRAETIDDGHENKNTQRKLPSLCKLHEWEDNQKILESLKQYRSVTEKRRRKLLTNLFITLRNLVYPDICNLDIQFSKQSILTQSRKDIISLTEEEKKLVVEKEKLLGINKELKEKLKAFLEEFKGTVHQSNVELSCKEVLPLLDEELTFKVEEEEPCHSKETDTSGLDDEKKDVVKKDYKDTDMDLFLLKGLGEKKVERPKKDPRSSRKTKVVAKEPDVLDNSFMDPCIAFDTAAILSLGLGAQETIVDVSALENTKKRHLELMNLQTTDENFIPLVQTNHEVEKPEPTQEESEAEQATNKRGVIMCNLGRLYSNLNKSNICFVMSKNTVKTLDSKDAKHITFDGNMLKDMGSTALTVGGLSMTSEKFTVTDLSAYAEKRNVYRDIIQKEHDYTTKHLVFQ